MALSCNYSWSFDNIVLLLLFVVVFGAHSSTAALGTFGFDIHHRYSDTVKSILNINGLPEKDTLEYYTAMVHRDHFRGRRLAGNVDSTPLTFAAGNLTVRFDELGFLHYAAVSVGTPSLSFLVALDTGSDLFWLPCQCTDCVRSFMTSSGRRVDFNMYSLNASSTSTIVSCNSAICGARYQCLTEENACAYQNSYISSNTSSTGVLVEDVLHLATNDNQQTAVDAPITLGCGIIQTGQFLTTGAPNGLFGLGMDNISVPSILASNGLTANAFSLCFGPDGVGRIVFGDKGSSGQGETPFNVEESNPSYNISMTHVTVGDKVANLDFTAFVDSGTSFTILHDPAYTIISDSFDSQVQDPRHQNDSRMPLEYCYGLRATTNGYEPPKAPTMSLTMTGGNEFNVTNPIVIFNIKDIGYVYCLAIIRSVNISIIGQNFMDGYRVVFDREKMVLGWKESNCFDAENSETGSNIPPSSPSPTSPPPPRPVTGQNSTEAASPPTVVPEATPGNRTNSDQSTPGFQLPRTGNAVQLNSFTCKLLRFYYILSFFPLEVLLIIM